MEGQHTDNAQTRSLRRALSLRADLARKQIFVRCFAVCAALGIIAIVVIVMVAR